VLEDLNPGGTQEWVDALDHRSAGGVGGRHRERRQGSGPGVRHGVFPWAASGRALSLGRDEGVTELVFEAGTHWLIGAGIVGPDTGELIAEAALAIEMGADAGDVGMTVHPQLTLSETVGMAAEACEGTIADLYLSRSTHWPHGAGEVPACARLHPRPAAGGQRT
jgi:pyridine nucleotide-disulfide oxidoreductase